MEGQFSSIKKNVSKPITSLNTGYKCMTGKVERRPAGRGEGGR